MFLTPPVEKLRRKKKSQFIQKFELKKVNVFFKEMIGTLQKLDTKHVPKRCLRTYNTQCCPADV